MTHLFGTEIKALYSEETVPRGVTFRITPTSHSELLNGDEPVSTLTQDFHFRLDNLLRTLVHAKPHFIRCIRPNETESSSEFDRSLVMQQVRSLQVLETVNLMAGGFPHRMRFKNFNSIYWMLAPIKILSRSEELAYDDCKRILEYLKESLQQPSDGGSPIVKDWALGKKHVFLTEGTRQHLETLRTDKRTASVTLIQSVWRGFSARKKWPTVRRNLQAQMVAARNSKPGRPRPQPISGTPPPEAGGAAAAFLLAEQGRHQQQFQDRCDMKTIQKTCSLFGLDPVSTAALGNINNRLHYLTKFSPQERPPPVPPSRPYTVTGNRKIAYPQSRVMKNSFPGDTASSASAFRPPPLCPICLPVQPCPPSRLAASS